MYKATIELIKARNRFTKNYPAKHVTTVKRIGGGQQHECYNNSVDFISTSKNAGIEASVWSGWLVQPYDKETNSSLILQHWWNITRSGEQFDTTPLNDMAEYVQDYDLIKFCSANDGKMKTHMAHSLLYRDNKFFLILDPLINSMKRLENLKTANLYELKMLF